MTIHQAHKTRRRYSVPAKVSAEFEQASSHGTRRRRLGTISIYVYQYMYIYISI